MKARRLLLLCATVANTLRAARPIFAALPSGLMPAILLGSLLGVSAASHASDGTVNFVGTISANTCAVTGGTGFAAGTPPTLAVTLPTIGMSSLAAAGAVDGKTPFSVVVGGCGSAASPANVALYWETGANTDTTTHALRNTAPGNANVEIQLLNASGTPMLLDGSSAAGEQSTPVAITNGGATLNYFAQYYATGPASAGAVASSVTFSIVYQ